MKLLAATLLAFASLSTAYAQTPAAPQGATGMCKDGTYSNAASKRGACAGHKGVKDWYASDAAANTLSTPPSATAGAPVPPTSPAATGTTTSTKSASAPAPTPSSAAASKTPAVAAAGGGNGQVWVNTSTKVYHCEGDRYYGKTKAGSYMTESAAVAAGDRAARGKGCAKG